MGERFPASGHDHDACVSQALNAAQDVCARRGARLTDLRRRVLELVWRRHEPVGAYVFLDALKADGRNAAPPTVYRALDFLMENGLVHRIERMNAYIGCVHPGQPHVGQFLLCRDCGSAVEVNDTELSRSIERRARTLGFEVTHQTIEVEGICPRCRGKDAHPRPERPS